MGPSSTEIADNSLTKLPDWLENSKPNPFPFSDTIPCGRRWVVQQYMSNIRSREEWELRVDRHLRPATTKAAGTSFRVDHRFGDKDSIFGRFSQQRNPMALGASLTPQPLAPSGPRWEPFSEWIGIELLELV